MQKKTNKQTKALLNNKRGWKSGKTGEMNQRKFNPKLEEYEDEDIDKRPGLQMFYAECVPKMD